MSPTYKIYRKSNYVYIQDLDNNKLYEEHSFRVLVVKNLNNPELYDISFLRPETTPSAFYTLSLQQIVDETNTFYSSAASWEAWYQDNTGDIGVNAVLSGPFGTKHCDDSLSTTMCSEQFYNEALPQIFVESGTTGSISDKTYSVSFASNGTAAALVSFDSGNTYVPLAPGTTVNMDAGSLGWFYSNDIFRWDTTASGASLLITYNA
jgi:hypothetical protein